MTRNILIGLALAAVGVALAVACASSDGGEDAGTGGTCKVSGQCTATEKCEDGKCVPTDGGILSGGGGGGGGSGSDGGGGGGSGDCANYTCKGCCDTQNICWPGGLDTACGINGRSCYDCTSNPFDIICSNGDCIR